jgi:uncharacterized membrane protein SirB2
MSLLKLIHISCAALSISGFFYRGLLKFYAPQRLQRKWLKITPHIVDTLLLASAIMLMVQGSLYPTTQPWVLTKLILLIVYIGLGLMTLRFAKTRRMVLLSFVLAVLCFGYIVAVALTRQPWPFV